MDALINSMAEKEEDMMKNATTITTAITVAILVFFGNASSVLASGSSAGKGHSNDCPTDSARVGSWCVDKYEASTWESMDKNTIRKFRRAKFGQRTDCMGKPRVEAMELTTTTRRAVRTAVMAAPQSMLFPFQA